MPHGFTVDVDDSETLRFSKTHKNGERTEAQADIVSSAKTSGPEQWRAMVNDPNGSVTLGTNFRSKSEARNAMKQWMKDNPKGVPSTDKGVLGMGGGIPGIDGGSIF